MPCHRQTSSTYTRYAVVGADDSVRPDTACALWGGARVPRRKENMHVVRRDTWVPPYGWVRRTARRGRRPVVERSGTNALGVRRPASHGSLTRCRGGRLCPPGHGLCPVGRDPRVPPEGKHAYCAAGHMGPALRTEAADRSREDKVVRLCKGAPCYITQAIHERGYFLWKRSPSQQNTSNCRIC